MEVVPVIRTKSDSNNAVADYFAGKIPLEEAFDKAFGPDPRVGEPEVALREVAASLLEDDQPLGREVSFRPIHQGLGYRWPGEKRSMQFFTEVIKNVHKKLPHLMPLYTPPNKAQFYRIPSKCPYVVSLGPTEITVELWVPSGTNQDSIRELKRLLPRAQQAMGAPVTMQGDRQGRHSLIKVTVRKRFPHVWTTVPTLGLRVNWVIRAIEQFDQVFGEFVEASAE